MLKERRRRRRSRSERKESLLGTAFNEEVWRDRAWARYTKTQLATCPPINSQWAKDLISILNLNTLVRWCTSRGLKVQFNKMENGQYDPTLKTISISCQAFPTKQLLYLLHECGHHLIGSKEKNERFSMGYSHGDDPEFNKLLIHRMAILEEECEAWERGRRLAKRLKLDIIWKDFNLLRLECLKSYVLWTASGYRVRVKKK